MMRTLKLVIPVVLCVILLNIGPRTITDPEVLDSYRGMGQCKRICVEIAPPEAAPTCCCPGESGSYFLGARGCVGATSPDICIQYTHAAYQDWECSDLHSENPECDEACFDTRGYIPVPTGTHGLAAWCDY